MDKCSFDIRDWCAVTNDQVLKNGHLVVSRENGEQPWLSQIYRAIGMNYPKFFKMDNLCKVGTLAVELLLDEDVEGLSEMRPDWAIVLMNSASSLDDDRHYQTTIQDGENYYPSPSVFVYTLANIVTGEIAIRHKIGGESSFFVQPRFEVERWLEIAEQTFQANPEVQHIVSGWVDYDEDGCNVLVFNLIRSENGEWVQPVLKKIPNIG